MKCSNVGLWTRGGGRSIPGPARQMKPKSRSNASVEKKKEARMEKDLFEKLRKLRPVQPLG
jgi:hypothetical protein